VAIAILATAAGLLTIPAFGQQLPCPGCLGVDTRMLADESTLSKQPVSVNTDRTMYDHDSMISIMGTVNAIKPGTDVGLIVIGPPPFNNIVKIDQIKVQSDRTFSTTLSTAGELWKYDGTYSIKVTYGSQEITDSTLIQLTGGATITPSTGVECGRNDLVASGQCVPYSIEGATVTSASFNQDDKSLRLVLNANDDGMITVNPSTDAIRGIFMVLVDGEEWDDVEINGNEVTVSFLAGTEEIEIIGTFAIPEFGTIAALILAVAIISIIAVTAKTRLNVIPKY
jgi:predicted secreted protein with PEFG-CTERM motif